MLVRSLFIIMVSFVAGLTACSDEPEAPYAPIGSIEVNKSSQGETVVSSRNRTNDFCEVNFSTLKCNVTIKQNNVVTWCGDSCRVCVNNKWSACAPSDPKLIKYCDKQ